MATMIPKTVYRSVPLPFLAPGRKQLAAPVTLIDAVQTAVQKIAEPHLQPLTAQPAGLAFQPRVMLAVLTYFYARQVYGSSQVLARLSRDEAFCNACGRVLPDAWQIESFRRQNSAVLESCLACALRHLAEEKVSAGFVTHTHEAVLAEEAKRRVIMAACTDSMAAGDGAWQAWLE